jgi:superoxide reductase
MGELKNPPRNADWKTEKHTPVIETPEKITRGKVFRITAAVGKEAAHPNTTPHHIRWIILYFQPEGEKFPYQIGNFEFTAHGESAQGPDTSGIYTHHEVTASLKTDKPGTIYALSYCNVHGLRHSAREIKLG